MRFGRIKYILNEYGVSLCSSSLLLIGCYLNKKKSFGVSLVGIPCAHAVQEASRVTQRRRAPLELLQESKYKTKLKYPCCSFTLHQKNLPPLLQIAQFALQVVSKTHVKHTQGETTRLGQPALSSTTETEEFVDLQSQRQSRKIRGNLSPLPFPPHLGRFPTQSLQRHLDGKS